MKTMKANIELISNIIVLLIIIISMLAYRKIDLTGVSLQSVLLFLLAAGWLMVEYYGRAQKNLFVRKSRRTMDIVVLVLVGYELLLMVGTFFDTVGEGAYDFNLNVLILSAAFLYYVISGGIILKRQYFDIFIYLGLAGMGVFLFGYLCNRNMLGVLDNILENTGMTASYTLPLCILGVYLYCVCQDKWRSAFYFLTAGTGFFVLLINHNIVSLWLMVAVFFMIPILFCPTAELVKRDMQAFFVFVFMMSNMSLLTNYTSLVQVDSAYLLNRSVYIDLLLAIGGVFFFHFWEKIPENVDLHNVILKRMYKRYCVLLIVMGVTFIGIITGGEKWNDLPGGMGNDAFKSFALPLTEEVRQSENTLQLLIDRQGVIGTALLLFLLSFLLLKIVRNYSMDKPVTGILLLVTIVFVLEMFFWVPSVSMIPVYFMAVLFAAFHRETQ